MDTGGWLSVTNEADKYHVAGRAYFKGLLDAHARLVTTDFILDETLTRLRYDVGYRKAVEFLELSRHASFGGVLVLEPVSLALWRRAEEIFVRYRDAKLSFTDCTSFAFLEVRSADVVFGYDGHFEMMGHILAPKA